MISVLMSTYRESVAEVARAFDSILNQTYTGPLEIVLVIDDPTNEPIKQWATQASTEHDNVILLVNQTNRGLARSLNLAFAASHGEYICRMDADDISRPRRLENQQAFLIEHNLDLIGGRVETFSEDGHALYKTPTLPSTPHAVAKASRWNNCLPHPTWFGKREVLALGYREIPLCEDYDLQLRAMLHGYKLGNLNEIVLDYRLTPRSLSRSNLYTQYLFQKYLTERYAKKEIADIDAITTYVNNNYQKKRAHKYDVAQERFNRGIEKIGAGSLLSGLIRITSSCLYSASFADKTRRILLAGLEGKLNA